jgi:hypothetical protein
MLAQAYRDILIETTINALNLAAGEIFVNSVRAGSWNRLVPINNTSYKTAMTIIVGAADGEGWLRELVQRLVNQFQTRAEFKAVLAEIDRGEAQKTSADPFAEVLVEGGRPFVNRQPLRARLLDLTNPGGSVVLLVDGKEKTGKTYSYYLINHVGPAKNFNVHRFNMASSPKPDELAAEILGRISVTVGAAPDQVTLDPIGNESAQRWAGKLADSVARAIVKQGMRRLFVFDEFPTTRLPDGTVVETPLPEGTASFLVRLSTYADEELRPFLRIVFMRFRDDFPSDLEDVLLRDDAVPFTSTDMVAVVMQVAQARSWTLTEDKVKTKIETFDTPGRTLNEKFKFLRGLLQELETQK